MKPEIAVIRIKNLRLRTYIGIKEDEIQNKQDVIINTEIHYCADKARNSDNMDDALNYRTITKKIIALVENNRFSLLENLTSQVLDIASAHAWVDFAKVEIDKPHALRFADSVSLELRYQKQEI
ncbi:dihydroneopterin triphosphate 2'-epimerase [Shewanella fidelis]|uniref:Dihydroneopterin triphosphate 2'-epimerase n=1 Tax=Shewanella fidelis TaxID=173509 RepID=A0AAW8NL31_9GAMM|nr:dihydroneopterin triphosphate 2'-epimerase [Shewanella fidelis]MDR8523407.1 dihydroneopterin triphosphate 2'-epimerase [Shewanella fidelis]MDW4813359.1 dihydroneopterin triphosphate 2'-epimerase [Shewanella fidelis]MDW4817269.1 dihydroneopterin triphosphate 2'-epimerase [Shewanella fidelis]MDW4821374.1 dihydroneopterin triphosphate 2'-epimerase [Shewanella fidelis]MDW4824548.1 dihydroneopterin triphosphate 2'-epimerase [Shewanella fidelis]